MPAAAGVDFDRHPRRRLLQRQRRRTCTRQWPHLRHARRPAKSCWCRRPSPSTCLSAAWSSAANRHKLPASLSCSTPRTPTSCPRLPQQQGEPGRRHLEAARLARSSPTRGVTLHLRLLADPRRNPGSPRRPYGRPQPARRLRCQRFAKAITGAWYETMSSSLPATGAPPRLQPLKGIGRRLREIRSTPTASSSRRPRSSAPQRRLPTSPPAPIFKQ